MMAAGFERLADQVERWENASLATAETIERRYHVGQMAPVATSPAPKFPIRGTQSGTPNAAPKAVLVSTMKSAEHQQ